MSFGGAHRSLSDYEGGMGLRERKWGGIVVGKMWKTGINRLKAK
jgi:hypothetical protein